MYGRRVYPMMQPPFGGMIPAQAQQGGMMPRGSVTTSDSNLQSQAESNPMSMMGPAAMGAWFMRDKFRPPAFPGPHFAEGGMPMESIYGPNVFAEGGMPTPMLAGPGMEIPEAAAGGMPAESLFGAGAFGPEAAAGGMPAASLFEIGGPAAVTPEILAATETAAGAGLLDGVGAAGMAGGAEAAGLAAAAPWLLPLAAIPIMGSLFDWW